MTGLTSKAMLVSLKVSQWSARKLDRRETAELMLKHGTSTEVARVNKSLLPMSLSLDAVHKKTGAVRADYYKNSLPWGQEGVNVIRAEGYMDFTKLMREHIYEWRSLVDDFIVDYPQMREDARAILNGMYREDDYPHPEDLRRKFSVDVRFFPIPEQGDWRVALSDDEMEELRKQTHEDIAQSQSIAMRDAWKRVHEVVKHAVDRLGDEKAVFRDSLIENAKEMCRVMSVLNVVDDANLENIRSQIEGALCSHTAEALRQAPDVRQDVADKMREIAAKMGAFYAA